MTHAFEHLQTIQYLRNIPHFHSIICAALILLPTLAQVHTPARSHSHYAVTCLLLSFPAPASV